MNFFEYFEKGILNNNLSHSFLIETNTLNITLDKILNFLFKQKLIKNINYDNNLNLILIKPLEKEILSEQIMFLQERYSKLPVIDEYNIYIIVGSDKLNVSAANKLLKFLEEPNKKTIGILITDNITDTLETLKSRCQIFSDHNDFKMEDNNFVIKILNILKTNNEKEKYSLKKDLSEQDRITLLNIITDLLKKLEEELNKTKNEECINNVMLLEEILKLLKTNVNIDLVLDKLFLEIR